MHSSPLRRATEQRNDFPFDPSPTSNRPTPVNSPSSRSRVASPVSADRLVALFKGDVELANKHEAEQKAFGDKREQCVASSCSPYLLPLSEELGASAEQGPRSCSFHRLVTALDETTGLVKGLAAFNQNKCAFLSLRDVGENR